MCPRTSCPLSSWTLNIVFGRASTISPSISIFSSLGTSGGASDEAHIHRLRSLVPRLLLILDLGVLGEGLEALAIDAGVVDEQVTVTFVWSDESVALLVVEPFDGPGRHVLPLPACARHCESRCTLVTNYAGGYRPNGDQTTSRRRWKGKSSALAQLGRDRRQLVLLGLSRPDRQLERIVVVARDDVDMRVEHRLPRGGLAAVEQVHP